MSLITCSKNCKFQKDGYCFKETTEVKMLNTISTDCVYFEECTSQNGLSPEELAGLGNGADTY